MRSEPTSGERFVYRVMLLLPLPFVVMVTCRLLDEGLGSFWASFPLICSFFSVSMVAGSKVSEFKVNPQAWSLYRGVSVSGKFPITDTIINQRDADEEKALYYIAPEVAFEYFKPKLEWVVKNIPKSAWQLNSVPIVVIEPMKRWIKNPNDEKALKQLTHSWYIHGYEREYTFLFKHKRDAVMFKVANM